MIGNKNMVYVTGNLTGTRRANLAMICDYEEISSESRIMYGVPGIAELSGIVRQELRLPDSGQSKRGPLSRNPRCRDYPRQKVRAGFGASGAAATRLPTLLMGVKSKYVRLQDILQKQTRLYGRHRSSVGDVLP
jgi:hypothetical protein